MFKSVWYILFAVTVASFFITSCQNDGLLSIKIDIASQNNSFNPLIDPSLSYLNLTIHNNSEVNEYTATFRKNEKINLGDVPVGDFDRITISGHNVSGTIIGYGDMNFSGKISAETETNVTIPFRYPLVYLSGARLMHMFHPYLASDLGAFTPIAVANSGEISTAVATSPDGITVMGASFNETEMTSSIWISFTVNNVKKLEVSLDNTSPITSITFSPDGSSAALVSTEDNSVKFINVSDFIASSNRESTIYDFPVDSPVQVSYLGNNRAAILKSTKFQHLSCDEELSSSLQFIDISSDFNSESGISDAGATDIPGYASSIASNPEDGALFISHPCDSSITQVTPGTQFISPMLSASNISPCLRPVNLAVAGNILYTTCYTQADTVSLTWSPAKLVIQRFDLSTENFTSKKLVVDYPKEAFVAPTTEIHQASSLEILQAPEMVLPKDISITVKSGRIVLLAEAYFYIREIKISTITGIYEFRRKSQSLIFIDGENESITNRFRAACYSTSSEEDQTIPELDGSYCLDMVNVFKPNVEFIPSTVTSLYGFK